MWSAAWGAAYEDLCRRVDSGVPAGIDPYAASSPGEFFAVMSEAFFEIPHAVKRDYAAIYDQLKLFYKQDPATRMAM